MKLEDIKGFPENIIDKKCETCEHERDSGNEYCGCCNNFDAWKEAGWRKDKRLAEIGKKELCIDVEKVIEVLNRYSANRTKGGTKRLAKAIAKTFL